MDIFGSFEESIKKPASNEQATSHNEALDQNQVPQQEPQHQDQYQQEPSPEQMEQMQQQAQRHGPGNQTGTPEEEDAMRDNALGDHLLGAGGQNRYRNLKADPDSWSPDFTARGFIAESGNSIMRGIGNHIMKGTGDMLQVAGSVIPGIDISSGSMLSRSLQEAGKDFAEKHGTMIPEELQHENLSFSSALDPKFWSIHVAELVPQIAEFIMLSKGGSALARKGAGAALKRMPGVAKTAAGKEVMTQASKGALGKLATDQGLKTAGHEFFGAIGGGVTGNIMSGMLNAADVVNTYKELEDADGNPLYTNDELAQMASGTMRNNLAWLGVDIASYALTFGGGWKNLKGLNPLAKGKSMRTAAERSKIAGKMFQHDISPIAKKMTKLAGKAGFEGFEESFQETFEEWAKKKSVAKVTGDPNDSIWDMKFFDYYASKENRATLVLSAAAGALGGATFNFKDVINNKAEEGFKTYDAIENLTKIVRKQGTDEDLEWQEYHIRSTIANVVADNKEDLYQDFMKTLVENENLQEEDVARYDEMFKQFKEVNEEAKALNIKGRQALLHHKNDEIEADNRIAQLTEGAKKKIERIKSLQTVDDKIKAEKIAEEEDILQRKLRAEHIARAEAIEAQENLIIGKRAKVSRINHRVDEFGESITRAGLSQEQYDEYVLGKKTNKGKAVAKEVQSNFSSLSQKGREMINNLMGKLKKVDENETVKKNTLAEEAKPTLTAEERKSIEDEFEVEIENNAEDGSYAVASKYTTPKSREGKKQAEERIKQVLGSKSPEAQKGAVMTGEQAEKAKAQAQQMIDDAEISEDETVSEDIWKNFKNNNLIDQNTINEIAETIYEKGSLTDRQDEIRARNMDKIQNAITKLILGTTDTNAKNEFSENDETTQTSKPRQETPEQAEARANEDSEEDVDEEEDEDADFEVVDEDLNEDEAEFVKAEVVRKKKKKSAKKAYKKQEKQAKKAWTPDKRNIKNAKDNMSFDKRQETMIAKRNIQEFAFMKQTLEKIRASFRNPDAPIVSENELDKYLNRTTVQNLYGPSNTDKMVVVNHQLKKMFPNMERPVQVHIARNLYQAIGSIGVGSALANTIYIDENSWQQDEIFMHEMSHIYFHIAKDQPETQKLIKSAIANTELVKETKALYDDYILYSVNINGQWQKVKKGDIFNLYKRSGVDQNRLNEKLASEIQAGRVKTVPLKDQEYIIEEMFAKQLEGPLAQTYDKIFNKKVIEPRRQKDVKKWWGMLRKKGAIIEEDNTVLQMMDKLDERAANEGWTLEELIMNSFKTATEGMTMRNMGMDKRIEEIDAETQAKLENIRSRKKESLVSEWAEIEDNIAQSDEMDLEDNAMEEFGGTLYNKNYNDQAKKASRLIRRFSNVYNKALRQRYLRKNKSKTQDWANQDIFDRDVFESVLYDLARENDADNFIMNIENSQFEEVQAFNRYMDRVHPGTKMFMLNSMYTIMSNAVHVNSIQNAKKYDKKNKQYTFDMDTALSQRELNKVNAIVNRNATVFKPGNNSEDAVSTRNAIDNIRRGKAEKEDFIRILVQFGPDNLNLTKMLNEGKITYDGRNIPIETLITGFLSGNMLKDDRGNDYYARIRPLARAIVSTNRKFTPFSTIVNAEGNMEPVRVVNNNLTKEIDHINEFLQDQDPNSDLESRKEAFMERFSHMNYKDKKSRPRNYQHNQLLESIFDNFQQGITPTLSQYTGIKDISDSKGNTYKNSTAVEQQIEDFMIFANTARKPSGGKNKQALVNLGVFADSPRKFFMNMKMIKYDEVFQGKTFHPDGKVINSVFDLHKEIYPNERLPKLDAKGEMVTNKKGEVQYVSSEQTDYKNQFKKHFKKAIEKQIEFINENSEQLSQIDKLKPYFDQKGELNREGKILAAESAINNMVHGYNMIDTFLPGAQRTDVQKRNKMNSSPIFSFKNPELKNEYIFFADEILNNSISGSDSGMYILEEDAVKIRNAGKGVFELKDGYKILNAHVEKDHPSFKGKSAYFKGYTTIVGPGHPLFPAMNARKKKYNQWHKDKYGTEPSIDLQDGTPNHMVIAIPESSDKNGFNGQEMITKDENGNLQHTELGSQLTPEALRNNFDIINKTNDDIYYKNGEFTGISSENFGPQQVMDKQSNNANTPVQMVNSVLVNAAVNGQLDKAVEIQSLISRQKQKNFNAKMELLKSKTSTAYRSFIVDGMNKEDMDQGQRLMIEEGGSLAVPYNNEISGNQLAKSLRKAGNKLETPGQYAQQRPDMGVRLEGAKPSDRLKGYKQKADGTFQEAEIVLSKKMGESGKVLARKEFTFDTMKDTIRTMRQNGKSDKDVMDTIRIAVEGEARRRSKRATGTVNNYKDFIGNKFNSEGVQIGYYVKGDRVIASRVPGHGPSSTGVFEVMGFQTDPGNVVSVSSEFNDITGADNDGDALFVQMKSYDQKDQYADWNKAFDLMSDYWLSADMGRQAQTKINIEEQAQKAVDEVKKKFPASNEYTMPFSPSKRAKDYNNTMVAKRNVGPVFNLHKIMNMLAAYEVSMNKSVSVNGRNVSKFQDDKIGNESRNQNSAVLANIILDNLKGNYADDLGIDENNIAQATLLVNMGLSLSEVGFILNSPAAKLWSKYKRNNNSMYHKNMKRDTIIENIYKDLGVSKTKSPSGITSFDIKTSKAKDKDQQGQIIELFRYLDEINQDLMKVSTVMSGHKKIHVNPLVLEKQLQDYKDLMRNEVDEDNKKVNSLEFNEGFRSNPDLQNYLTVAEQTLDHIKTFNPVYRTATNKVLQDLRDKIGEKNIGISHIENMSMDIQKFVTSRLLGLNNLSKTYVNELMDPTATNKNSIFNKMHDFLEPMRKIANKNDKDKLSSVTHLQNSILLRKALNMNLKGPATSLYISANPNFVNEGFTQIELERARQEFEDLPTSLQDDLMMYDLITHGWKGKQSMYPFFGKSAIERINNAADLDLAEKGTQQISPVITETLEKIIAVKMAKSESNPFDKIYLNSKGRTGESTMNPKDVIFHIQKNDKILNRLKRGESVYINVVNGKYRELYEVPPFTDQEIENALAERGKKNQRQALVDIGLSKLRRIPGVTRLGREIGDIDLATISDGNVQDPFKSPVNYESRENMDAITEATIRYEDIRKSDGTMDARESYDEELFSRVKPLSKGQFSVAMEFNPYTSEGKKAKMYEEYLQEKEKANKIAPEVLKDLDQKSEAELLKMYETYGDKNAYAYSVIMTPIIKQLANNLEASQTQLWKDNDVEGTGFDGNDVSKWKAYMMSGSTIPSNHPAAQAMARMLEKEYKAFIGEKRKYMKDLEKVSRDLYADRLGYGQKRSIANTLRRIRDLFVVGQADIYKKLYGNLVTREEKTDDKGNLTYDFKLRPKEEIEKDFQEGRISEAEKNFYDHFVKTTKELKPKRVKTSEKGYIPHTAMSDLEAFSSRGLLGLMTKSKDEQEALYDVKMYHVDPVSKEKKLMNFKTIEDIYKAESAGKGKNDINKILEYRQVKKKAKKLLKDGKNEDGTKVKFSMVQTETALGFGAINRFANNRSITAQQMPSMDLNKALGDYIHATLFVDGNENFRGMRKLQGYVDGVLAFNRENNLDNMNKHVQMVWKDYFLRGKRQTSPLGKKADKVIRTLTKLNLFYALGYQANKNTGGLYALGNIAVGKYHNIKDLGGKAWIRGEMKYWGLDKGLKGGPQAVVDRFKRNQAIMKNLNFMDINIYDEVNIERKHGLDKIFSDIALMPMVASEKWIQQVHMLGMLTDEELERFDAEGNYKPGATPISNERIVELEDNVKSQHGRGYQPTDQRAAQMYSYGNMMLQFSKFIPTMVHDRFSKKDVNIYGREHVGSLRQAGQMLRYVYNNPKDFVRYRASLSEEERRRLDSALRGAAIMTVTGMIGFGLGSDAASDLYWDANYYFNYGKLSNKAIPPAIQSTDNLLFNWF